MLTTSIAPEDKLAAYDLNVAGYIHKGTAGNDFRNLADLVSSYSSIVNLPC